jgi:CheY-like chemotaxis protein
MRVLLVEDNPVNRRLIVELLAMKGVETDTAENGEQAVRMLQSRSHDTYGSVLMDLQMPVLDGYEASKIIRSDPKFDALPIIALSAHVLSTEKERCNRIGMNGYISKPFDPEYLWQTLLCASCNNIIIEGAPSLRQDWVPLQGERDIVINGLNLQDGLNRSGGDRTLYAKVVADVLGSCRDGCDDLLKHARQNDGERGSAQAHELKGVFGAIGAVEIQDAMASIEEIFRIGADPCPQILSLEKPYATLMEGLGMYLEAVGTAAQPDGSPSQDGAPLMDAAWIEAFTDHLGKGDFVAVELWESNKNRLGDRFSPADLEQIGRALQQFDFARALVYFTPEPKDETTCLDCR